MIAFALIARQMTGEVSATATIIFNTEAAYSWLDVNRCKLQLTFRKMDGQSTDRVRLIAVVRTRLALRGAARALGAHH